MSNGLLSRKGMIAVLASVMFAVTACSDKDKVKDLEGENGKLRQQISKINEAKKSAEQKLAESEQKISAIEAMSESLAAELNDLKSADVTIANLARQIQEKRRLSEELDNLLNKVRGEHEQAEADLAQAQADEATARSNAKDQMDGANRQMSIASTMMAQAKARRDEALKQEARILEAQAALDERQEKIDNVAKNWRELYAEHKLDAVFDRLTDENKMNDAFTFQFSVVALNVSVHDIRDIRDIVNRVQKSEANTYQNDMRVYPSEATVNKVIADIKKRSELSKDPNASKMDKVLVGARTMGESSRRVMNDSYLIKATGSQLIAVRDELKKMNGDNRAVFMVPRLVEKLSVSMTMRVKVNAGDTAVERDIEEVVHMTLSDPNTIDVDLSKPIDVTKPMNQLFPANQCKSFDAACLGALAKAGLLSKSIKTDDGQISLKSYLRNEFRASADQARTDIQAIDNGFYEKGFWSGVGERLSQRQCINTITKSVEDCNDQREYYTRRPTVEVITLEFAVNQIQELPYSGYVPVDFAMNNNFEKLAVNMNDGKLHIQLPIQHSRSVEFNAEQVAMDEMIQTFGESSNSDDLEKEFSRVLSSKVGLYGDFVRALK